MVVSNARRTAFTDSGLLKTRATSGSNRTAVIPSVITLLAFMFRDAYRVPDLQHPRRKGSVDIPDRYRGWCSSPKLSSAWWRHEWLITSEGLRGGALALAVLYLLRLQNPTGRVPHSA